METIPTSNHAKGEPESLLNKTLETGASLIQNFDPPKRLCAHLYDTLIATLWQD